MKKGLPKVFLAIGMKEMEEFLKKRLSKEFKFVGEAVYREAVVKNALQTNPDIIILRETLNGSTNVLDIVYEIRLQLPDARIIFLASDRKPGDTLLAELVGNGVYDFLTGNKLAVPDLIQLMREPNKFSDVAIYRPKATIGKNNEVLYEAPPIKELIKQVTVTQTVYVEGENQNSEKSEEQKVKEVIPDLKEEKKTKPKRKRWGKEEKESPPKQEVVEEKPEVKEVEIPLTSSEPIPPIVEESPVTEVVKQQESEILEKKTEPIIQAIVKEEPSPKKEEVPPAPPIIISQPIESPEPKNQTPFQTFNGKQKILTFVGGDHGVGNSQIAFNTAIALGKRGFKTIFIELKEEGSTIEYLYQLAMMDKGLDYALNHLAKENFTGLDSSIIRMDEVRTQNQNALMSNVYRDFPSMVDYLFFSPDYVLETDPTKKVIEPSLLKELCMHLFFQEGYHYIVLDAEPNLFNPFSEVALGFGTHIFYTITQDVCHIGRAVRNISEINKRINVTNKLYYIVNKFDEQAALSRKDIEDWLKSKVETTVPNMHKEFINANMNGQPILLTCKDKQLKRSYDEIVAHILEK